MQTLRAAHELLHRHWPGDHPSSRALLDYHLDAADLYDRIAEIDPAHQHEARYWAHQDRDAAHAIAEQIGASTQATASD
ncbi:MAG TPA: AMED_5909 family protein [Pseudonocardiaceae bacterium]|nr:AMED_5909 family protein [Pseudonocardiaceae bacterium]